MKKKVLCMMMASMLALGSLAGCSQQNTQQKEQKAEEKVTVEGEEKEVLQSKKNLAMMDFPIAGSTQTYDSTSFAPDSASTATSIATGEKTWSGSINVSLDFSEQYETIAEKLKEQKEYKIGVVSSVNINHATPAAFYAHQPSRNSYYEIGQEMIDSEFDYFAGGALLSPTGKEEDQKDLYALAEEAWNFQWNKRSGGDKVGEKTWKRENGCHDSSGYSGTLFFHRTF